MDYRLEYKNYISFLYNIKDSLIFKWLTVSNMAIIEGYKKKSWEEKPNIFLQTTKNNKIRLAENILENGMIFPFFSKKVDNTNYIILGSHRLESLKLYERKHGKLNKTFLCIELPDFYFAENSFNTCSNAIKTLRQYPNKLNSILFLKIGSEFNPFKGFNNEKDFKKWIDKDGEI